jgi:predicted nucleotidyltransferase
MDLAHPLSAISPSLEGEVLQVLARNSAGMTGRQIALLTGRRSHSGVIEALNRLTEQGVVSAVELNRASLYSLNRAHLTADAVIALSSLRAELIARIRRRISEWDRAPLHASLFGSIARGDGGTSSDIDLFVVRPSPTADDDPIWRGQLDALRTDIESWTGNRAAFTEVSEPEVSAWVADAPPIVSEIRRDAIFLGGSALDEIVAWLP